MTLILGYTHSAPCQTGANGHRILMVAFVIAEATFPLVKTRRLSKADEVRWEDYIADDKFARPLIARGFSMCGEDSPNRGNDRNPGLCKCFLDPAIQNNQKSG